MEVPNNHSHKRREFFVYGGYHGPEGGYLSGHGVNGQFLTNHDVVGRSVILVDIHQFQGHDIIHFVGSDDKHP